MTLGLGFGTLDRIEDLRREGRKLRSFNEFVETCERLQYGEIGNGEMVELSLNSSNIEANGKIVQLKTNQGVKQSHQLPFPIFDGENENFSLDSGTVRIELSESENDRVTSELFFDISRGKDEK